jgi:antitoxin component of MazEF toxin-antitoxin module
VGRDIAFDIQDGNIVLHPVTHNENDNIESLIAQITPKNKHEGVFS